MMKSSSSRNARARPVQRLLSEFDLAIITAKYYAHFAKARRERLEERVKELWA